MKKLVYQEGLFNCKWLSKFINCWFFNGEKSKIENLLYSSILFLNVFLNINGLLILFEALENLKPWIGLKIYRSAKQLNRAQPVILTAKRQYRKAVYWLVKSIQIRKESNFKARMVNEIKGIVFGSITNSLRKKKNYYNYAVLCKTASKFKW